MVSFSAKEIKGIRESTTDTHAPTPTGFAEIVSDDFPIPHATDCASFALYAAI
jgi:hypothetical protein